MHQYRWRCGVFNLTFAYSLGLSVGAHHPRVNSAREARGSYVHSIHSMAAWHGVDMGFRSNSPL